MDETFLIDDAKEKLCFVSLDLNRDLRLARNANSLIKATYVLSDGVTHTKGYVKDPEAAKRFLSLSKKEHVESDLMDKDGGRKKADMNKNVNKISVILFGLSLWCRFLSSVRFLLQEIDITDERFLVPETLFQPADLGLC